MKKIFTVLSLVILIPQLVFAQTSPSVQEECFTLLLENMKETTLMETEVEYLSELSYSELESEFSKKYKTTSSLGVGIGLDEPHFSTRLFSFGEPTGYTYPRSSFLPESTKSEAWSTTTRQYIVAEEFVTDLSGNEHFIGCFFIGIEGADLLSLTSDNYAGDMPGISLFKVAGDASYKAWFAETPSVDKAGKPLVTWNKVFVYPQATKNSYFDKYTVAEAFPANKVVDFSVLSFLSKDFVKVEDFDENTGLAHKYFDPVTNEELDAPEELRPVMGDGIDLIYPYATYYQAIEAAFPEFGSLLSIRGTLKYKTFIELVTSAESNPELQKFMDAFARFDQYNQYYKIKQGTNAAVAESPEFDRIIPLLQNGDWTVAKIKEGATFETLVYQVLKSEVASVDNEIKSDNKSERFTPYVLLLIPVLLGVYLLYRWRKGVVRLKEDDNLNQ